MMRRVLWVSLLMACVLSATAQDFTSFFLQEYETDTLFSRVTVSPEMIGRIIQGDTVKDGETLEMISSLKSMQVLSSPTGGKGYYDVAVKVLENHPKRFQPLLSYSNESESGQIAIRKKNDAVVELIMLVLDDGRFAIISFTGDISSRFISALTESVKPAD